MILALIIICFIYLFNNYLGTKSLIDFILFLILLFAVVFTFILNSITYLKELKNVIKNNYKTVIGIVIRYRKVSQIAGELTDYVYYPIFRNIISPNDEIELGVEKAELGKKYYCIYYPITKVAVCEEITNVNL